MLSLNNNCEGVQCLVSAHFQKGMNLFEVSTKDALKMFLGVLFIRILSPPILVLPILG